MKKNNEEKRENIIIKTSIIGILVNILLVIFKAIVGLLSNSIAIILDAVNNLSDALSSIVTIIATKIADSEPDKKHPLGHGRVEYLSAMIVAGIIFYAGITSLVESIKKIINPEKVEYSKITLLVLLVSIILKLVLGKYVKTKGENFNSPSLVASGSEIFIDAVNEILGKRVDKDIKTKIKKTICEIENVYGAYDLVLHNYGPDKYIGSVHIEIPDSMTAEEIDPLERHITDVVLAKHNVYLSGITIYSMNTKNEEIIKIHSDILKTVMANEGVLEFHGFYIEEKNKSIRFDIIIDYSKKNRNEIYDKIYNYVKKKYPDYTINIKVDIDI